MLRAFVTAALVLATGSGAAAQTAPEPARAAVKLVSCSPSAGSAVFYGRMHRVGGAERMSMRFGLLERSAQGTYHPVHAPRLRRWRTSRAGVAAFGYRQRVKGLDEDAVYRARVEFRWHDAGGDLIRRAWRRSRPCSQLGPLPNLRARVTRVEPTATAGVSRYVVRAINAGTSRAEQVAVSFEVDGSAVDTKTVPAIEPGEAATLEFRGPACEGSVRAVADPQNSIRESSERDNSHSPACSQLRG